MELQNHAQLLNLGWLINFHQVILRHLFSAFKISRPTLGAFPNIPIRFE
jgi:hypothetical protein